MHRCLEPEPHEVAAMNEAVALCRSPRVGAGDLRAWQDVLMDSAVTPLTRMRVENQTESGCQGYATTANGQARLWYLSGHTQMLDLSARYAYQGSQYLMTPGEVGKDRGSSIHSGCRLQIQGIPDLGMAPGQVLESDWPETVWCRSSREFAARCKTTDVVPGQVSEVRKPPESFEDMLALTAAGACLHQGTFWGPSQQASKPDGRMLVARFPRSGGGHATAGVWGKRFDRIGWLLAAWNSHGYGHYWIDQAEYTRLQEINWQPFGAFVLQPPDVVERYNRIQQGGGYFA